MTPKGKPSTKSIESGFLEALYPSKTNPCLSEVISSLHIISSEYDVPYTPVVMLILSVHAGSLSGNRWHTGVVMPCLLCDAIEICRYGYGTTSWFRYLVMRCSNEIRLCLCVKHVAKLFPIRTCTIPSISIPCRSTVAIASVIWAFRSWVRGASPPCMSGLLPGWARWAC